LNLADSAAMPLAVLSEGEKAAGLAALEAPFSAPPL